MEHTTYVQNGVVDHNVFRKPQADVCEAQGRFWCFNFIIWKQKNRPFASPLRPFASRPLVTYLLQLNLNRITVLRMNRFGSPLLQSGPFNRAGHIL
jgi:hypothetical protein